MFNLFNALLLAVVSIALAALLSIVFIQRRGLKQKLMKRYPGSRIVPVRFTTLDALIAGQPPARSAAWGFLVVDGSQCWIVGRFPASGLVQELQVGPDCRVAFIPKTNTGMGIPDMVRIAWGGRVLFLFADIGMGGSKKGTYNIFTELSRLYPVADIPLPAPDAVNKLLYPLAALMFLGVAAILYFLFRAVPDFSVDTVDVAANGAIAASSTRELVLLNADESIVTTILWKEMGIAKGAADIKLVDEDEILVGDFAQGSIKQCSIARKSCQTLKVFASPDLQFKRTFKFALAPDNRTLLAVDTARHRLLQFDRESGNYKISSQALCFPNRIRIGPQGQVLVADTNNHRILEWPSWQTWLDTKPVIHAMAAKLPEPKDCREAAVNDAFLERPVELTAPAKAFEQLNGGRIWPTDFTWMPDGKLWVLLGNDNLRYGDLAIFDASWQFIDKAAIAAETDVAQVIAQGNEVLLVDPGQDVIRVANSRGEVIRELSVEHLGVHAQKLRSDFQQMRRYGMIAMGVVLSALMVTIGVAIFSMRRRLRQLATL